MAQVQSPSAIRAMAPSFNDIFLRLPPSSAILVLNAVFGLTAGHAVPRQTKVVDFHTLSVIPFPPAPTDAPRSPFDLLRREDNTICGYIGGNPDLPATCLAGSHCVLDAANSAVGCCPNGGACTTGVFTGCVDWNSDPQTEINPYVFTCQGSDVCYKNNFAGGYFQYGCGTAFDLGTTVHASASGASAALSIGTVHVSLTESAKSLATPTTIGTWPTETGESRETSATSETSPTSGSSETSQNRQTSTADETSQTSETSITGGTSTTGETTPASTSSSTTLSTTTSDTTSSQSHSSSSTNSKTDSSSSTSSKTQSTSSTTAAVETSSSTPSPSTTEAAGPAKKNHTGAIVGGVIGGAAGLLSILALLFFCLRRRKNPNRRTGPGAAPQSSPVPNHPR
ncbi:hypothetical protein GGS20DRAFT_502335 [Poronia punctata]|nr:hypothetical protein GGS20DRAFT_502335 [Poronia punctata]